MSGLFDIAIATIFAREVLEGAIVIGQYRTVLLRSPDWQDPETQKKGLRAITNAALGAALVALVVCVAISVPLILLSKELNDKVVQLIEGISKLVAAVCILELSLKIPKWIGLYASKKTNSDGVIEGLSLRSIRFNVAWNIWREVAETGVYLIPFFLSDGSRAIPLSAAIGVVISLFLGIALYFGNKKLEEKFWLAFFMSGVTGVLSVGLFTGGSHELEKALGKTKTVWELKGDFWSTDRLPMTIFKPFGYSSTRTVLQIVCFWTWLTLLISCHFWKWRKSSNLITRRNNLSESTSSVVIEISSSPEHILRENDTSQTSLRNDDDAEDPNL